MTEFTNKTEGSKTPTDLTGQRNRKCLIYTRVSTTNKDQETANQVLQLQEYAHRQGWVVIETIEDYCSGGKTAQERQGLKRVFELAHRKSFDVLLFWALDRLSREGTRATIEYLTTLEKYGVDWHSFTEQYLSTTNMGVFRDAIISLLSCLAKQQKIRISETTKAGLQRTVRLNGTKLGRKPTPIAKIEQAKDLRKQGLSFTLIGKEMGITRGRAHQLVRMAS